MDSRTVARLTDTIVRDVNVGIHDGLQQTDVRADVIGEIGINGNPPITNERKSMRAAARASRMTGAPVLIHLGGAGAEKHEMLDIIEDGPDGRTRRSDAGPRGLTAERETGARSRERRAADAARTPSGRRPRRRSYARGSRPPGPCPSQRPPMPEIAQMTEYAVPNLDGRIQTVRGPIAPSELGFTLTHEHIFIDLRQTHLPYRRWKVMDDHIVPDPPLDDWPASEMAHWESRLNLRNMHEVRAVAPIADNYILESEPIAVDELRAYRAAGGKAVIDATSIGLKRDPLAIRRISDATDLHIVLGTGYYQRVYHPYDMDTRTVDDLTEVIVRDVTVGIHDGVRMTDVRSGVIGEIGINGNPLITNERKSMRAAARASRITGAPILFHLGGVGREKHEMLDIIEDEGVDLRTVILGHCDDIAGDVPFTLEILSRGVFIAFDNLGREPAIAEPSLTAICADAIPKYIEAGHLDRLLLSQDICWKTMLKAYGGVGYTFIQDSFLPRLTTLGVTREQIDAIMVGNPARAHTFVAPIA